MQKTTNYQLNQWEPGDAVNREDFNSDNAAIDAALGALTTAVESKAEQADLDATNAALGQAAASNCMVKLFETTLSANGDIVINNIPDLVARKLGADKTLADVRRLVLECEVKMGTYTSYNIRLRVNGSADNVYHDGNSSAANTSAGISPSGSCMQMTKAELARNPGLPSGVMISYFGMTATDTGGGAASANGSMAKVCPFEDITGLTLYCGNSLDVHFSLDAGSTAALYAVM